MLGGIFEKNKIKDKIQTFDKKITQEIFGKINYLPKKFLKKKNFSKYF